VTFECERCKQPVPSDPFASVTDKPRMLSEAETTFPTSNPLKSGLGYFNFAYSALACCRMGMSGLASFHTAHALRLCDAQED